MTRKQLRAIYEMEDAMHDAASGALELFNNILHAVQRGTSDETLLAIVKITAHAIEDGNIDQLVDDFDKYELNYKG